MLSRAAWSRRADHWPRQSRSTGPGVREERFKAGQTHVTGQQAQVFFQHLWLDCSDVSQTANNRLNHAEYRLVTVPDCLYRIVIVKGGGKVGLGVSIDHQHRHILPRQRIGQVPRD